MLSGACGLLVCYMPFFYGKYMYVMYDVVMMLLRTTIMLFLVAVTFIHVYVPCICKSVGF
jgi:hypothetical protein